MKRISLPTTGSSTVGSFYQDTLLGLGTQIILLFGVETLLWPSLIRAGELPLGLPLGTVQTLSLGEPPPPQPIFRIKHAQ